MTRFKLIRDVTRQECPWLRRDFDKGEELRESTEFHYGCFSPAGIGCMEMTNDSPAFEIPKDALNLSEALLELYKQREDTYRNNNDSLYLTVIRDLNVEEFPFILKDFKEGDRLYFYPDYDPHKVYIDCIPAVEKVGDTLYFELPNSAIRSILG